MDEATLTRKARKAAEARGAAVFKIHGGRYSSGVPDLLGCHQGTFFAAEMKMPGKERNVTELQNAAMQRIRRAGGIARVCSSVEHVLAILDAIEEES